MGERVNRERRFISFSVTGRFFKSPEEQRRESIQL